MNKSRHYMEDSIHHALELGIGIHHGKGLEEHIGLADNRVAVHMAPDIDTKSLQM